MENTVTKENLEVLYNYLKNCLNNTVYFKHYNNDYTLTIVEPPYSDDAENIVNKEQSKIDTSLPYLNFFLDDFYTNKEHISDFLNYRNTVLKLVDATLKKITKKLKNIHRSRKLLR